MPTYYFRSQQTKAYDGRVSVTRGRGKATLEKEPFDPSVPNSRWGQVDSKVESTNSVKKLVGSSTTACWWRVGFSGQDFSAVVSGRYWNKVT